MTNHVKTITESRTAWDALYDAHVLFAKELYTVRSSLDIVRVVGLNTHRLSGPGAEFVRFASLLSQRTIITGIESLFERKNDGAGLCSVRGLLTLTQNMDLRYFEAARRFANKYDVAATADCRADIEKVLEKQRSLVAACTTLTSKVRNQRVAHLAQLNGHEPPHMLPGVDACERVSEFAYDFSTFILTGFLNGAAGADMPDRVGKSLYGLLKKSFDINDARCDFPEPISPEPAS